MLVALGDRMSYGVVHPEYLYVYMHTHGGLPKRLCLNVAAKPAHPADPPYLED